MLAAGKWDTEKMIKRVSAGLFGESGAVYSDCEQYRYRLWRRWDDFPLINFVMLNPSTATELANDATIERCERRAKSMGFGGLIVTNLFAFRATDPEVMKTYAEPVGPENDAAIVAAAGESCMIVCGWGQHGKFRQRGAYVLAELLEPYRDKLHALKFNADGSPMHPLYVGYSCQPIPYPLQ